MRSVIEVVLSALNRIKLSPQSVNYLVFLDENLPFVNLSGSLIVTAKDFGSGAEDKELWKGLLELSKGFVAVLIISADRDFTRLSLDYNWRAYKKADSFGGSESKIEVIDLNQLSKRYLRSLGIKKPVAQSKRRQKIKAIKGVYGEWLNSRQKENNKIVGV